MKNQSFAYRLNLCLDKEGFPPKHRGRIQLLAEMVGLTHRGASKWINGESCPPAKKYASLARKLNVNEHWLRTGEGDMTEMSPLEQTEKEQGFVLDINIYDVNSLLSEHKIVLNTLKCSLSYMGHFFGVRLDTEAMSPRFPKNSIIIFDDAIPKDGDFVLVNYIGYPSPIFRQYLEIGGAVYLNAHNPKFDRLILTDKSKVIGKLAQAILYF